MQFQSITWAESCQEKSVPLSAFDTAPRFDPNYSLRFSGVATAAAVEVNALIGTAKNAERDAVSNIVYNLHSSYATGTPYFRIGLNKNNWRGLRKYRKAHLGYTFYRRGLDRMKAADFIDFGGDEYHGPKSDRNRETRVKIRPRLAYIFEELRPAFDVLRLPDISAVEVRDSTPEKQPIAPPEPRIHRAHEKTVDKIQKVLTSINTSILTNSIAQYITGEDKGNGRSISNRGLTTNTKYILREEWRKSNIIRRIAIRQTNIFNAFDIDDFFIIRRIFNNSCYDYGGRFYHDFQSVPKGARAGLLLDGERTIELDYGSIHARMLYAERGVNFGGDPYQVKGFERGEVKVAFNIMLNATGRREAIGAIKYKTGCANAAGLASAVASRHDFIRKEFYTGVGLRLQRRDSGIAERVMLDLLPEAVIPIHDSFIIRESREAELRDVMESAYRDAVGFPSVICRADVK